MTISATRVQRPGQPPELVPQARAMQRALRDAVRTQDLEALAWLLIRHRNPTILHAEDDSNIDYTSRADIAVLRSILDEYDTGSFFSRRTMEPTTTLLHSVLRLVGSQKNEAKQQAIDAAHFLITMPTPFQDDTRSTNRQGQTPLHLAVMVGSGQLVSALKNPSVLNAQDNHGNTAVHMAAINNASEVIFLRLLNTPPQAQVNIRNRAGYTPLAASIVANDLDTLSVEAQASHLGNVIYLRGLLSTQDILDDAKAAIRAATTSPRCIQLLIDQLILKIDGVEEGKTEEIEALWLFATEQENPAAIAALAHLKHRFPVDTLIHAVQEAANNNNNAEVTKLIALAHLVHTGATVQGRYLPPIFHELWNRAVTQNQPFVLAALLRHYPRAVRTQVPGAPTLVEGLLLSGVSAEDIASLVAGITALEERRFTFSAFAWCAANAEPSIYPRYMTVLTQIASTLPTEDTLYIFETALTYTMTTVGSEALATNLLIPVRLADTVILPERAPLVPPVPVEVVKERLESLIHYIQNQPETAIDNASKATKIAAIFKRYPELIDLTAQPPVGNINLAMSVRPIAFVARYLGAESITTIVSPEARAEVLFEAATLACEQGVLPEATQLYTAAFEQAPTHTTAIAPPQLNILLGHIADQMHTSWLVDQASLLLLTQLLNHYPVLPVPHDEDARTELQRKLKLALPKYRDTDDLPQQNAIVSAYANLATLGNIEADLVRGERPLTKLQYIRAAEIVLTRGYVGGQFAPDNQALALRLYKKAAPLELPAGQTHPDINSRIARQLFIDSLQASPNAAIVERLTGCYSGINTLNEAGQSALHLAIPRQAQGAVAANEAANLGALLQLDAEQIDAEIAASPENSNAIIEHIAGLTGENAPNFAATDAQGLTAYQSALSLGNETAAIAIAKHLPNQGEAQIQTLLEQADAAMNQAPPVTTLAYTLIARAGVVPLSANILVPWVPLHAPADIVAKRLANPPHRLLLSGLLTAIHTSAGTEQQRAAQTFKLLAHYPELLFLSVAAGEPTVLVQVLSEDPMTEHTRTNVADIIDRYIGLADLPAANLFQAAEALCALPNIADRNLQQSIWNTFIPNLYQAAFAAAEAANAASVERRLPHGIQAGARFTTIEHLMTVLGRLASDPDKVDLLIKLINCYPVLPYTGDLAIPGGIHHRPTTDTALRTGCDDLRFTQINRRLSSQVTLDAQRARVTLLANIGRLDEIADFVTTQNYSANELVQLAELLLARTDAAEDVAPKDALVLQLYQLAASLSPTVRISTTRTTATFLNALGRNKLRLAMAIARHLPNDTQENIEVLLNYAHDAATHEPTPRWRLARVLIERATASTLATHLDVDYSIPLNERIDLNAHGLEQIKALWLRAVLPPPAGNIETVKHLLDRYPQILNQSWGPDDVLTLNARTSDLREGNDSKATVDAIIDKLTRIATDNPGAAARIVNAASGIQNRTALHVAFSENLMPAADALLSVPGIDVEITDNFNQTQLILACDTVRQHITHGSHEEAQAKASLALLEKTIAILATASPPAQKQDFDRNRALTSLFEALPLPMSVATKMQLCHAIAQLVRFVNIVGCGIDNLQKLMDVAWFLSGSANTQHQLGSTTIYNAILGANPDELNNLISHLAQSARGRELLLGKSKLNEGLLSYAIRSGHDEFAMAIINACPASARDIDRANLKGVKPSHLAALRGAKDIIKALQKAQPGLRLASRDTQGLSVLDYAIQGAAVRPHTETSEENNFTFLSWLSAQAGVPKTLHINATGASLLNAVKQQNLELATYLIHHQAASGSYSVSMDALLDAAREALMRAYPRTPAPATQRAYKQFAIACYEQLFARLAAKDTFSAERTQRLEAINPREAEKTLLFEAFETGHLELATALINTCPQLLTEKLGPSKQSVSELARAHGYSDFLKTLPTLTTANTLLEAASMATPKQIRESALDTIKQTSLAAHNNLTSQEVVKIFQGLHPQYPDTAIIKAAPKVLSANNAETFVCQTQYEITPQATLVNPNQARKDVTLTANLHTATKALHLEISGKDAHSEEAYALSAQWMQKQQIAVLKKAKTTTNGLPIPQSALSSKEVDNLAQRGLLGVATDLNYRDPAELADMVLALAREKIYIVLTQDQCNKINTAWEASPEKLTELKKLHTAQEQVYLAHQQSMEPTNVKTANPERLLLGARHLIKQIRDARSAASIDLKENTCNWLKEPPAPVSSHII